MDPDDRRLLEEAVSAALPADADAAALRAGLDGLGWRDMLAAEPETGPAVVGARLGRIAAPALGLDDVVAAALGLSDDLTIIHPLGTGASAGPDGTVVQGVVDGGRDLDGVVWASTGDALVAVEVDATTVEEPTITGGFRRIGATEAVIVERVSLDPGAWASASSAARAALGHQLRGIADGMLDLARAHAVDRIQFGRPIASFQAVRHKLAETYVATETARATMAAAEEDPSPLTVDLGRAAAGRAVTIAARHCQQVLAGIGFTRDHDFHRFLFRALDLDGVHGSTAQLVTAIGRSVIDSGEVPRVVEL